MRLFKSHILCLGLTSFVLMAASNAALSDDKLDFNAIKFPVEACGDVCAETFQIPHYLSQDVDITVLPPHDNDSLETQAELDILRKYQAAARTPEEVAAIKVESKGFNDETKDYWHELLFVVPDSIDKELSDRISAVLDQVVFFDLEYFTFREKKRFMRARPTQLADDLTTVVDVPDHPSYPSGHAAQSRLVARIMGYIDADRAAFYEKNAMDVAVRREVAGVHFPSDTRAGVQLANDVFDALMNNGDFKREINGLRADYLDQVGHG